MTFTLCKSPSSHNTGNTCLSVSQLKKWAIFRIVEASYNPSQPPSLLCPRAKYYPEFAAHCSSFPHFQNISFTPYVCNPKNPSVYFLFLNFIKMVGLEIFFCSWLIFILHCGLLFVTSVYVNIYMYSSHSFPHQRKSHCVNILYSPADEPLDCFQCF